MEKVAEFIRGDLPSPEKFCYVETYGCQQNEADSETIRGMAIQMGYGICDSAQDADLIVFNTCAVREHAEQRVFGNIGALSHLKKKKPGLVIALCGCMAGEKQVVERIRKSFPYVSMVVNGNALWQLPELLFEVLVSGKKAFAVPEGDGVIAEGLPKHRDRSVKAWLPIMYGCNNFCSYCIVPYVRGRERSRRPDEVIKDAKELLANGAKDITLLGQNVNSYRGGEEGMAFPELITKVAELDGDFRLRFMTSHPKDANDELFKAMAGSDKIARHLHLPFQSGSDRILKLMNRGYSAEHYKALVASARKYMPELVVTGDVIVGFPGETEEDFMQTMALIEEVRYDALFTFIFSPRKGTKAASMTDDTPDEVKKERFARLVKRQNEISAEIHAGYVGRTLEVLVDGESESAEGKLSARTDGGRLVVFEGDNRLIGEFVKVRIEKNTTWSLVGSLV
ncbi:MAG: tRNA (N6-isopentenyl adenosine(37)-C2)-methylthiotransferase MiaB [Clostridia bacterium]|nr:tRNA (N6-isopentenyl adenosine(37)-C2)-methylthiotransferase MiaB [Clostridia bacterium]